MSAYFCDHSPTTKHAAFCVNGLPVLYGSAGTRASCVYCGEWIVRRHRHSAQWATIDAPGAVTSTDPAFWPEVVE